MWGGEGEFTGQELTRQRLSEEKVTRQKFTEKVLLHIKAHRGHFQELSIPSSAQGHLRINRKHTEMEREWERQSWHAPNFQCGQVGTGKSGMQKELANCPTTDWHLANWLTANKGRAMKEREREREREGVSYFPMQPYLKADPCLSVCTAFCWYECINKFDEVMIIIVWIMKNSKLWTCLFHAFHWYTAHWFIFIFPELPYGWERCFGDDGTMFFVE